MRRKILPVILVILILGIAVLARHHRSRSQGQTQTRAALSSIPVVEVYQVHRGDLTDTLQLNGQVTAKETVNLQSQVSAPITSLAVSVGQRVSVGQVVARLDDTSLQSELANAQAALEGTKAKLDQVLAGPTPTQAGVDQANVDKAKVAMESSSQVLKDTQAQVGFSRTIESNPKQLSDLQSTLDQAEASYQNAQAAYQAALQVQAADQAPPQPEVVAASQASVAQAQAQVAGLQTQESETAIRAPFNGTVTALPVAIGSLASPGIVLMTIQGDQMQVNATVSQADLSKVHPGTKALISPLSGSGTIIPGSLAAVNPAGNAQTLSFTAIISPSSTDGLLPGEAVQVELTDQNETGAVLIPSSAIVTVNGGVNQAFIVRKDIAHLVTLRLGLQESSWSQVLAGVAPGDLVVTSGQTYLADDDRVKVAGQKAR